eukprot:g24793.t1
MGITGDGTVLGVGIPGKDRVQGLKIPGDEEGVQGLEIPRFEEGVQGLEILGFKEAVQGLEIPGDEEGGQGLEIPGDEEGGQGLECRVGARTHPDAGPGYPHSGKWSKCRRWRMDLPALRTSDSSFSLTEVQELFHRERRWRELREMLQLSGSSIRI